MTLLETITFVSASFGLASTPAGAFLHFGAAGTNGPAVFDLAGSADIVDLVMVGPIQIPGSLALLGIGKPIDVNLALIINAAPSQYYVNIVTTAFPGGKIRGQLAAAVPVPAALLMFGPALLGIAGFAHTARPKRHTQRPDKPPSGGLFYSGD